MKKRFFRGKQRRWIDVTAAAAIAGVLAACSVTGPAGDADGDGTIDVVLAEEPNTLSTLIRSSGPVRYVSRSMVETLVARDTQGGPTLDGIVTGIAAKENSSGEYVLQLRPNVKFHDGSTLTAEDAAFSINQVLTESTNKIFWDELTEAEASGDLEVVVKVTNNLTAHDVLARLSQIDALPKSYFEDVGKDGFGDSPIGTGPFKFVTWDKGLKITTERFGEYWDGTPGASGVNFTFSEDASTRKSQVESGVADITTAIDPQLLNSTNGKTNVEFVQSYVNLMWQFANEGLTSDVRIRKAISLAFAPQLIIDRLLDGHGLATFSTIPEEFTGAELDREHDVEAARRLVDEVKAEKGELPPLELSYWSGRYASDTDIGEATAGQIAAIGLKVQQIPLANPQYLPKMVKSEFKGLHMTAWGQDFSSPDFALRTYALDDSTQEYCRFLKVDDLYASAKATTDAEERKDYYSLIERTDLVDKVCNIPIVKLAESYVVSDNIEGFVPSYDGIIRFADLNIS
ncbi:ABC transporter substrate-binding protein [Rhodococcus opacus]|nr:ABC transporter substrate-binding protein [Rhodococcus opacus]